MGATRGGVVSGLEENAADSSAALVLVLQEHCNHSRAISCFFTRYSQGEAFVCRIEAQTLWRRVAASPARASPASARVVGSGTLALKVTMGI